MGNTVTMIEPGNAELIARAKEVYDNDPEAWKKFIIAVQEQQSVSGVASLTEKAEAEAEVEPERVSGVAVLNVVAQDIEGVVGNSLAICEEMNIIRSDPAAYVQYLEAHLATYGATDDELVYKNTHGLLIKTVEGKAAVEECISVLKSTTTLPALKISLELEQAAKLHQNDLSVNGILGHDGSDGSNTKDRIERYCQVRKDFVLLRIF
jgi:hypothetical protein